MLKNVGSGYNVKSIEWMTLKWKLYQGFII